MFAALLGTAQLFAQSKAVPDIINLSKQVFVWEVDHKIDSLKKLLDEKFVVVSSNGESQSKIQYLARLRSGNFAHNRIEVKENTVTVVDNTAVLVGKGKFDVTVSGTSNSLHLSYTEVFTRPNTKKPWKLLAMHASLLDH